MPTEDGKVPMGVVGIFNNTTPGNIEGQVFSGGG